MRFPRPVDSTLHGATDYTAGTLLMTVVPRLAGVSGTPAARQIRAAGAIHDRTPAATRRGIRCAARPISRGASILREGRQKP